MKIILFVAVAVIIALACFIDIIRPAPARAAVYDVSMSTTVQEYLTFDITQADSVPFGNLTPGTPICYATGTIASVTTNAANGYTLGVHDGSATDSALVQSGVYIPDMTNGTIATPVVWGSNYGQGIGLYAADTNKEAKWGTGTTVCDANNKYAAIPLAATTAHTVTGYHAGADTSSWSFKIDVQNTQKTGAYSGNMTFTATAILS